MTMKYRRITGLFGAAVGALAVGDIALAQDNSGSTVNLGGSIADTVMRFLKPGRDRS